MAAPTLVQELETSFNSEVSPRATASFNVLAGDVLIAWAVAEAQHTWTISGGSLVWTLLESINTVDDCGVALWTATVDADKSMTVTFTRATGNVNNHFGGGVQTWRGSAGVGAAEQGANESGAPSLAITTTQPNSAIAVINGDWAALDGASRTWRSVNGSAATEATYYRDSAHYALYSGYHPDAGAAGSQTVGLSAPAGQDYVIVAVEVLGSGAAEPTIEAYKVQLPQVGGPARGPGLRGPGVESQSLHGLGRRFGAGPMGGRFRLRRPDLQPRVGVEEAGPDQTIEPPLVESVSTVYSPSIEYVISPPLVDSAPAVFDPTVTPGDVTITAPLVDSGPTVYSPTVSPGAVTIEPPLVDSGSTVLEPTVTVGPATISPPLVDAGAVVYSPTVSPGAVTITVPLVDAVSTVHSPTVAAGALEVSPPLVDSGATVFAPTISPGAVSVAPPLVDAGSVIYVPTISQEGAPPPVDAIGLIPVTRAG